MDDSDDEEFEPLFDYSRIQPRAPVHIKDDKPTGVSPVSKKHKGSKDEVEKKQGKGNAEQKVIVCDDDDEEDWLPPPPKNLVDLHKIHEDSTLKALRLKKQELASYAQSAEEMVRAAEESVRKDLNASFQSSPQSACKKPVDPHPERAKIVISFQNKDETKPIRVYMDEKFERIFKLYGNSVKHDVSALAFLFDGEKIKPTATPASLGMEDDDMIEVHIKSK